MSSVLSDVPLLIELAAPLLREGWDAQRCTWRWSGGPWAIELVCWEARPGALPSLSVDLHGQAVASIQPGGVVWTPGLCLVPLLEVLRKAQKRPRRPGKRRP